MRWILTPGQERVRSLAKALLPKFLELEHPELPHHKVYHELLEALRRDNVVTIDPITSAPLSNSAISLNYVDWLDSISTPGDIRTDDRSVRFDKVLLGGSAAGWVGELREQPIYIGGDRSHTTMRAVFTIVSGQLVGTDNWHHIYYTRSRLLCGDKGNHRLIGYILTGETALPYLTFRDEHQDPDPWLNKVLLFLEDFWEYVQPGVKEPFNHTHSFELDTASFDRLHADVTRVRQFMTEASDRDLRVIAAYLHGRWRESPRWIRHEVADGARQWIDDTETRSHSAFLLRCLWQLREIDGRGVINRSILRFQRGINRKNPASHFEQWYEEHQHDGFPSLDQYRKAALDQRSPKYNHKR
jgi:hypothetical protein